MKNKNKGFISIAIAGILAVIVMAGIGVSLQDNGLNVGNTVGPLPVRNFLGLTDTPSSYSGQGGKVVSVNSGATALEFTTVASGTPTAITVADTTDTTSFVGLWTDATGDLGPKTDAGLTYNATTGMLTATGLTGPLTGNASTASALFANGSNCTSGSAPLGVGADGAVESCFDVWTEAENTSAAYISGNQSISLSGDVSGSGTTAITTTIGSDKILESMLKAVDAASDENILTFESTTGDFEWHTCAEITGSADLCDGSDASGGGITGTDTHVLFFDGTDTPAGDAGLTYNKTTNALTADTFLGALTGNVTGNVSGTAATVTGAAQASITSLGTLTTLTVDDITINGNTISSAGASTLAITPTAGQAITFDGTVTLDAGVIAGATSITSTTFVGALTGNSSTATALAADPADCGANAFAISIVASGALTCAGIADADVPNNITIDLATSASDLTCTDCINATEIEDIYALIAGDTFTGAVTINDNGGTGSTLLTIGDANDADSVQIYGDITITGGDITLGTTSIFSGGDTASLNNIDAINATTETTFESALDIAGDVTGTGLASVVIADNAVDGTDIALGSDAAGDIMYYDGTNYVRLAKGTAGQVLEMNAGATAPEWDTDDGSYTDPVVRTYLTAGSPATWTKPAGLKYVIVEVQAGGGTGADGSDTGSNGVGGGGGGAGGYSRKLIAVGSLGATETVTTGAAGAASSFGAHATATAGGNASTYTGGAGGIGSSGNINLEGQDGGSSAESGSSDASPGGTGGASHLGGGGRGGVQSVAGATGNVYGGGGGGGYGRDGTGSSAGAAGAAGIVIVTEHYQ